jgi:hypothetical protein
MFHALSQGHLLLNGKLRQLRQHGQVFDEVAHGFFLLFDTDRILKARRAKPDLRATDR